MFNNIPDVKLGIIAVSRDCFIVSLSEIVEKQLLKLTLNNMVKFSKLKL